jgi:hypothetical protein
MASRAPTGGEAPHADAYPPHNVDLLVVPAETMVLYTTSVLRLCSYWWVLSPTSHVLKVSVDSRSLPTYTRAKMLVSGCFSPLFRS